MSVPSYDSAQTDRFLRFVYPEQHDGHQFIIWLNKTGPLFGQFDDHPDAIDGVSKNASSLAEHNVFLSTYLLPCDWDPVRTKDDGTEYHPLQERGNFYVRGTLDEIAGINALVLDLDTKEGHGVDPGEVEKAYPETFEEIKGIIRELTLPPSVVVDTGHGYHCWYVLDQPEFFPPGDHGGLRDVWKTAVEALQHKVKQLGYDCDSTGDLARVARLPGSLNVKDKQKPKPVTIDESLSTWERVSTGDVRELAASREDAAKADGHCAAPSSRGVSVASDVPLPPIDADGLPEGVSAGSRHETLVKLVGQWINQGDDPSALQSKAAAWNSKCTPPEDQQQVRYQVSQMWGSFSRSTGRKGKPEAPEPDLVTIDQLEGMRGSQTWLWTSWIPVGLVSQLFGPPGSGKTTLAAQASSCVTGGRQTWPDGTPVACEPSSVLWLDYENAPLGGAFRRENVDTDRVLLQNTVTASLPLLTDGQFEAFFLKCLDRISDLSLVVVDSLSAAVGSIDENSNQMVRPMKLLSDLANRHGLPILLIHHGTKAAFREDESYVLTQKHVRGHSSIAANARSIIAIDRPTGLETRRLRLVKSNLVDCEAVSPM